MIVQIPTHKLRDAPPTSAILQDLLRDLPGETVTLQAVLDRLGERGFGLLLLLLGLVASLPGVCIIGGAVLIPISWQMIRARFEPVLPAFLASHAFGKRRLDLALQRAVPPLRFMERYVRPRSRLPLNLVTRLVGIATLLLALLIFVPLPFSNIPPALAIMLLAFAYFEEDGVLLCLTLTSVPVLLLLAALTVWQTIGTAAWLAGLLVLR